MSDTTDAVKVVRDMDKRTAREVRVYLQKRQIVAYRSKSNGYYNWVCRAGNLQLGRRLKNGFEPLVEREVGKIARMMGVDVLDNSIVQAMLDKNLIVFADK